MLKVDNIPGLASPSWTWSREIPPSTLLRPSSASCALALPPLSRASFAHGASSWPPRSLPRIELPNRSQASQYLLGQ